MQFSENVRCKQFFRFCAISVCYFLILNFTIISTKLLLSIKKLIIIGFYKPIRCPNNRKIFSLKYFSGLMYISYFVKISMKKEQTVLLQEQKVIVMAPKNLQNRRLPYLQNRRTEDALFYLRTCDVYAISVGLRILSSSFR